MEYYMAKNVFQNNTLDKNILMGLDLRKKDL